MKSLALIGGSGFIGKSIIEYIDQKKGTNLKIKRIYLYQRNNFSFKNKNISLKYINKNFLSVKKFPETDYIIFGIKSDSLKSAKLIFNHFKKKILNLKKKPTILFLSSGAVYGPISKIKKISEDKTLNISLINNFKNYKRNYAKEKFFFEKNFLNLRKKNFRVFIVRGFTFVGKYVPLDSIYLIGNLIENVIKKKNLIFISNKRIIRSYMYADDFVRCIIKIIQKKKTNGDVYNVGSDDPIDSNLLLNKLSKKYNLKIIKNKINRNKVDYYVPSIKKLKKKLNFKIKIKSYEAIIKTINLLKIN